MRRPETCPTCGQPDNCGDCTHVFLIGEYEVPVEDTVCECGHWHEEHVLDEDGIGSCEAPGCACQEYKFSAEASTPEAIADRGGDPEKWPAHVKSWADSAST